MLLVSVIPILFGRLSQRELLFLWGTSRKLRALASEDHAWTYAFQRLTRKVELGDDELALPAYPVHERGERRDVHSHLPCEAEHLELAGLVLPDDASIYAEPRDRGRPGGFVSPFERERGLQRRHLPDDGLQGTAASIALRAVQRRVRLPLHGTLPHLQIQGAALAIKVVRPSLRRPTLPRPAAR